MPFRKQWKIVVFGIIPIIILLVIRERLSWQRPRLLPVKSVARSLAFSPDSQLLAVGDFGWLQIWDAPRGNLLHTLKTGGIVQKVAFSPDGTRLACGMSECELTLWDWEKDRLIKRISARTKFQLGSSSVGALAFSPDGQTLVVALDNGELQRWNLQSSQLQTVLPGEIHSYKTGVTLSKDGKMFARREAGAIHLYDTQRAKLPTILKGSYGGSRDLALGDDGVHLASFDEDDVLRLWSLSTGTMARSWSATSDRQMGLVVLSSDGSKVSDGYHLWNVTTGELERQLQGHPDEGISFSPNGALLAVGSTEDVKLWRLK